MDPLMLPAPNPTVQSYRGMRTAQIRKVFKHYGFGSFGNDNYGLTRGRDGTWTAKESYFYQHGRGEQGLVAAIKEVAPRAQIIKTGDHWAAWPKDSYWWVQFRIPGEY